MLLLVSDHGFGRYEKLFHLNRVLEDAGLLTRERSRKQQLAPRGLSTRRVIDILRRLDVFGMEGRVPNRFKRRLAVGIDSALSAPIDTERTLAFAAATSAEAVFISPHVPEGERASVAGRVIDALKAARDPDTGQPIVENVYRREEVYDGSELHRIPDILLDFGDRPYLASDRLSASSIVERVPEAAGGGRHRRYGILVAVGPGVTPGTVEGANIVDIAPTALHALGLPIPEDMDGRVLEELFTDGRVVERSSAADSDRGDVVYTDEEAAAIEKSLENLGYI
jgi:predicted AlkP superfamily phosphohydrolase/phosphomutase